MLCPILCSCGKSLDDLNNAFRYMRAKIVLEECKKTGIDIKPEQVLFSDAIQPMMKDTLDQLGITMVCCRQKILTNVELTDLL